MHQDLYDTIKMEKDGHGYYIVNFPSEICNRITYTRYVEIITAINKIQRDIKLQYKDVIEVTDIKYGTFTGALECTLFCSSWRMILLGIGVASGTSLAWVLDIFEKCNQHFFPTLAALDRDSLIEKQIGKYFDEVNMEFSSLSSKIKFKNIQKIGWCVFYKKQSFIRNEIW